MKKIAITVLLILINWLLSVEFAFSAEQNKLFVGVAPELMKTWNDTVIEKEEPVLISDGGQAYIDYFGYVPTSDELNLLYMVVMAECGYTEPDSGVRAVCDTIANRCRSDVFPNTLYGVLTQYNQFQTVSNGAIYRYKPTERVIELCNEQIVYGNANRDFYYFTAGDFNPYSVPLLQIGNHYFGGLR